MVVKRTDTEIDMVEGRDVWWHEALGAADPNCPAAPMDAEDPLFILFYLVLYLHITIGIEVFNYSFIINGSNIAKKSSIKNSRGWLGRQTIA